MLRKINSIFYNFQVIVYKKYLKLESKPSKKRE